MVLVPTLPYLILFELPLCLRYLLVAILATSSLNQWDSQSLRKKKKGFIMAKISRLSVFFFLDIRQLADQGFKTKLHANSNSSKVSYLNPFFLSYFIC